MERTKQRALTKLDHLKLGCRPPRIAMKVENHRVYESFRPLQEDFTPADAGFITGCLSKHFIFSSLFGVQAESAALEQIFQAFFHCEADEGQLIIRQGDGASSFFVIERGRVLIEVDGKVKKEIGPGQGFGELALLYDAPRSASCRAGEACRLFGINRVQFRKAVQEINANKLADNRKFLEKVRFFACLPSEVMDEIAVQLICNEGEQASSFYILTEGSVKALLRGKKMGVLREGDSFGENALLSEGQVRSMSVVAEGAVRLLSLGRDRIAEVLGQDLAKIIFRNKVKAGLAKSTTFGKLTTVSHERIVDSL